MNDNDLPQFIRDVFRTGTVHRADGSPVDLESAIREEEAEALFRTVKRLRPQRSLEVGFGQGISTLAILSAVDANGLGEHHVADPFEEHYDDVGLAMVQRHGLDRHLTFHRDYVEFIAGGLEPMDFVLIDASHKFDLTMSAFVVADMKLKVGGVIAFHDTWMESQQAVINFVLTNRDYRRYEPEARPVIRTALWRRLLRKMPFAERVFRYRLMHPWREVGLNNLAMLEKTAEDNRDFDHFVTF